MTLSSLQASTFVNVPLILLFPFRRSKKWSENHDLNSVIRTKLSVLRIVTSLLSVYFAVRVIMCQIRDEDRRGDFGHCHCISPVLAAPLLQQKRRGMLFSAVLSCTLNWFCVCKFRDLVKTTKVLHFSLFISVLPIFQSRPDNLFLQKKNKHVKYSLVCVDYHGINQNFKVFMSTLIQRGQEGLFYRQCLKEYMTVGQQVSSYITILIVYFCVY